MTDLPDSVDPVTAQTETVCQPQVPAAIMLTRILDVRRPRKMMPTDPIQAMEFAQSKGQARKEGKTGITFSDIAGMEATKEELQEVVEVSWGQKHGD